MGLRPRAFLAGSLGFAVAFVVACGSGAGLLSSQQANGLNAQLDSVSSAVNAGQCASAGGAVQSLQSQVAALPSTINSTLADNLGQGASTLSALANRNCSSSSSSSTTTSSHSTSTSTTTHPTSSSISTTTVTNSSNPTSSTDTGTATNPGGGGTSTTSNGGAGIGGTTTVGGNQNGQ